LHEGDAFEQYSGQSDETTRLLTAETCRKNTKKTPELLQTR
jgi:hypothetical protein